MAQVLLLEAIRFENERRSALAIELLTSVGEKILRALVREASDCENPSGYRLRALGVIARIGPVTDKAVLSELGVLAAKDRNPEIREAAAALTVSFRLYD
jgi:hypothetical protein